MRTKLFAAFLSSCAVIALSVAPAGALAGTVTLQGESGEGVPNGSLVSAVPDGQALTYSIWGSEFDCVPVAVDTLELVENSVDPLTLANPWASNVTASGPCNSHTGKPGGSIAVEMSTPQLHADGSVATEVSFDLTWIGNNGKVNCHVAAYVPAASWQGDGESSFADSDFGFSGEGKVTSGNGCPITIGLEGEFALQRYEAEEDLRLVSTP